ncbi:phosphodiester glycosidase family protein [Nocardioides sp. GY 10127]|uniref:phosphodiester glycosidase family protein n=1 Tax=Nocardioides sp. GY 10127 TaxID=2569762 RepID=UPI0010A888BD|nr:phosphodiester glycosidase family protein [Nocardioides sp. GY 10127]TIC84401.1 phosphodiester glycosidase family protein [Nocardioides sp. GY 10127]
MLDHDAISSTGESGTEVSGRNDVVLGLGGSGTSARTSRLSRVRPGVTYTKLVSSSSRGTTRATLLTVDLRNKHIGLDVVDGSSLTGLSSVRSLMGSTKRYVAAVNGDFFDIEGTNAPLGTAYSPTTGLLNARSQDWNQTLMVNRRGRVVFDKVQLYGRVVGIRHGQLTNVNSATVIAGGIGLYTRHWGSGSPGYAVVEGHRKHVRMVVIQNGRVTANRPRIVSGRTIKGSILIGRGSGATALRALEVGQRVTVRRGLVGHPRLALTGGRIFINDGVGLSTLDDTETAPRTVVGIDRDTGQLLMLAIDGRSTRSRGFTLDELVSIMEQLGADEALNLDGGGSTTMVVRRQGRLRTINTPSDGRERAVANALVVTWTK